MKLISIDLRIACCIPLFLAPFAVTPAHAEQAPAAKVLTMTGLKRDTAKLTTKPLIFTGLKRQTVEIGPGATDTPSK